jgi:hypothetical protein
MGSNGRKGVENYFSWERISSQNLEIYKELCPRSFSKPEQQKQRIRTQRVRIPGQRIISLPNKRKGNCSSLTLEARLHLPDEDISEDTKSTVKSLISHFASHGFEAMQKDHYLKIRGDLEHLTTALVEARKEIIPMQNYDVTSQESKTGEF